ncbi:Zinc finger CCCH domain-containing protein 54 [Dichanthelium oligosanthes]|uniref:Zinc finger CCCH domain-containing protein 54 n=1 Tax=Dichanthelium oligosanthes TaxID=888268 RepID=A0A1E5VFB6_9POAL|nr:Zinc finger CCCH domain-containing protein 54 [Dichanthelium oligosanthes]
MDFPELAKLAFSRVQKMEPQHVGKILGCILLREPDEEEMVQLAYGNDAALHAKISDAKATLAAIYARCSAQHHHQIGAAQRAAAAAGYHPVAAAAGMRHHFSPAAAAFGFQFWPEPAPGPKAQPDFAFVDAAAAAEGHGHYALQQQNHNGLDDHQYDAAGGYYYTGAEDVFHNGGAGGGLPPRAAARRANGLSTRRSCHYFTKSGGCKNGQNCPYPHHSYSDGFANDSHHNGGGATPGALEKLEMEITELLNSRHGQPLSIASLPTLYGERYGKGLQAEGYLTESQRHGKAGYSLTKLLSRLNKIRVIERPHGQHSVVLAEDAARYTEFRGERGGGDMGSVPASSHQIYLTFPAESTFVEEDVATYFGQYGPVRDVRIPCQERRMFGFVSFQNSETVSTILMRRNPHFICGSRVLVKPYREKSKCIERTYVDKMKPMHYYPTTRFFDFDPDFYPDEYEASSRIVRKQLAEKRERLIELERKRLAEVRLEPLPQQFAYFDCSIGDENPLNGLQADSKDGDLMDRPLIVPDSLENVSTSQAPQTQASNNYDDKERYHITNKHGQCHFLHYTLGLVLFIVCNFSMDTFPIAAIRSNSSQKVHSHRERLLETAYPQSYNGKEQGDKASWTLAQ